MISSLLVLIVILMKMYRQVTVTLKEKTFRKLEAQRPPMVPRSTFIDSLLNACLEDR